MFAVHSYSSGTKSLPTVCLAACPHKLLVVNKGGDEVSWIVGLYFVLRWEMEQRQQEEEVHQ